MVNNSVSLERVAVKMVYNISGLIIGTLIFLYGFILGHLESVPSGSTFGMSDPVFFVLMGIGIFLLFSWGVYRTMEAWEQRITEGVN